MLWWFPTEMALISWNCFQNNKQVYSLKICSLKILFMIKVELLKKIQKQTSFHLIDEIEVAFFVSLYP